MVQPMYCKTSSIFHEGISPVLHFFQDNKFANINIRIERPIPTNCVKDKFVKVKVTCPEFSVSKGFRANVDRAMSF